MFSAKDKLVDRYEIIRKVGEGAMGIVYKAQDTNPNLTRLVAIKALRTELCTDEGLRNLKLEAATARKLNHKNIAWIDECYEWDGPPFIVMEFVQGQTLEAIINERFPLPFNWILDIAIQISKGLQHIHSMDVVHRDIKPKNIMIADDDLVKITDFGVSNVVKQTMIQLTGTPTGMYTKGTLPYMAPEQLEQKSIIENRSDVYAFGISLHQMLTKTLPFNGMASIYWPPNTKLRTLTELYPELNIPSDLSQIVMRCLEKDPADRYTASELLESLEASQQTLNNREQIPYLIRLARAKQLGGEYSDALEIWEKIKQIDPSNREAQTGIANIQESRTKQRIEIEKKNTIDNLVHQAQVQSNLKNYEKVVEICRQIWNIDPDNIAAKFAFEDAKKSLTQRWSLQAYNAWNAKEYQNVVELNTKILEIDTDNQSAKSGIETAKQNLAAQQQELTRLIQQAQDKMQTENFKSAIDLWQQVLQLDSENQVAKSCLENAKRSFVIQQDKLIQQAKDETKIGKLQGLQKAVQILGKVLWMNPDNQIAISESKTTEQTLREHIKERDQLIAQAEDAENKKAMEVAIRLWTKVLEIDPEHQIAKNNIEIGREALRNIVSDEQPSSPRTQEPRKQKAPKRKIDFAVDAVSQFIHHLHRPNIDYGLIATFGDTFEIQQDFTDDPFLLQSALEQIRQSVDGRTRLYDSILGVIEEFHKRGDQNSLWLLTIITDGIDNESVYDNPVVIGNYIATRFMNDPMNLVVLIGVGEGNQIDVKALTTMSQAGKFPVETIAAFPELEKLFLRTALKVSERLVGRRINIGSLSWEEIGHEYQVSQIPIDYAFLIDRSSSMKEPG